MLISPPHPSIPKSSPYSALYPIPPKENPYQRSHQNGDPIWINPLQPQYLCSRYMAIKSIQSTYSTRQRTPDTSLGPIRKARTDLIFNCVTRINFRKGSVEHHLSLLPGGTEDNTAHSREESTNPWHWTYLFPKSLNMFLLFPDSVPWITRT